MIAGQPFEVNDTLGNNQACRTSFFSAICCAASVNLLTGWLLLL